MIGAMEGRRGGACTDMSRFTEEGIGMLGQR